MNMSCQTGGTKKAASVINSLQTIGVSEPIKTYGNGKSVKVEK